MKINKLNELIPWAQTDFEIKMVSLVKYPDSTTLVEHQKYNTYQDTSFPISNLQQAPVVYPVGAFQSSLLITSTKYARMWQN